MSKENKIISELRFPEFANQGKWEEKKLGEVGEIITGNTPSTTETINYNGNKLFVSPADINQNRYISQTKTTLSDVGFLKTRRVQANSVLFVCIGSTIGKVAQNKVECATNQQINSIVPSKEYSSDFLYSILEYSSSQISELAGIQAVPIINKTQFSCVKLFFPKLNEQQKIASCFSSLDEVITAHSQKLKLLKYHKKGLMQNLFPQEGEKVPKYRFKEFENDGEWAFEKLNNANVAEFINEKTDFHELEIETYISTENILQDYGGILLSKKLPSSGSFTKFKEGDILVSNIRPYLRKVWFSNISGAASNDIIVIRAGLKIDKTFLSYHLKNDNFIDYIMKGAEGVKMPRGDKDLIKEYFISFPKPNEQQKIATCLSSLDTLIIAKVDKIEQLKLHKKGLMQGLFPKTND